MKISLIGYSDQISNFSILIQDHFYSHAHQASAYRGEIR